MSNDEFAKRMMLLAKPASEFKPSAYYDSDGDCIEFLAKPDPFYEERVDDLVTVYYSQKRGSNRVADQRRFEASQASGAKTTRIHDHHRRQEDSFGAPVPRRHVASEIRAASDKRPCLQEACGDCRANIGGRFSGTLQCSVIRSDRSAAQHFGRTRDGVHGRFDLDVGVFPSERKADHLPRRRRFWFHRLDDIRRLVGVSQARGARRRTDAFLVEQNEQGFRFDPRET